MDSKAFMSGLKPVPFKAVDTISGSLTHNHGLPLPIVLYID